MWAPVSRPTLTGRNPGRLGVVSVLDAGDQLAAVLQRVPAHEGRLASAALRSVKTAAGEAELRQSAAPPQSRCGPPRGSLRPPTGVVGPGHTAASSRQGARAVLPRDSRFPAKSHETGARATPTPPRGREAGAHLAPHSGLLLEEMLDSEAQRRRGVAFLTGPPPGSCSLLTPPKPLVRPARDAGAELCRHGRQF